ncbi:EAL domain-containing protein [Amphritea balenae]|uniref:EAL domain-containing protein n=1 Tax=Amphritea balenae TaxID=452629 RepID=A0A3P1SPP8_9GAMM|nr:EAL domain-containing protein [Amphritea balenae]RRC98944.1 EAL domain-containing protein [Amphritea balenae]GGK63119.1 GGDEF domain-containing protein [Amphritea balenae]
MSRSLSFRFGYIMALVAAAMAAILLLATLFFTNDFYASSIANAEHQLRQTVNTQLAKDTEILANTLAVQLAPSVANKDISGIQHGLQTLSGQQGLSYLNIYDQQGNILYALKPSGNPEHRHNLPNVRITQQDNKILANVPVLFNEKKVGAISYAISLSGVEKDIRQNSAILTQKADDIMTRMLMGLIGGFFALLLLMLPISQILAKRLLKPLDELTDRTRSFKVDGDPISFRLNRSDEIGELSNALQDMQEHLYDSHEQMALMAYRDPLTSLPNRRGLYQELRKLTLWCKENEKKVALLFIDLDHFKQINDSSSHEYGDLILKEIAQRLLKTVRLQMKDKHLPFPEDLLLSRMGGDEFVAILPDIEWLEDATDFSQNIIEALRQPFVINDKYFTLSCSIGITLYPDDASSAENMLKHADIAMYEAKRSGRNRARFFLPEMHHQVQERVTIQQGIGAAITENQLFLEYQPIFDLNTRTMIGAEALLRWKHPEKGKLEPDTFIPIVEESDQIGNLTRWIIQQVCDDLHSQPVLSKALKLTINISSVILNQPELAQQLNNTLRHIRRPHQQICLEITETSLMKNLDNTLPLLKQWKEAGYSIWIDDFGTGYSSLSYLARLPIDGVKIDRSFINDFENSKPVIEAILALAETMQLLVVSEGIEEPTQQQALTEMGCTFGQGYLLSGPVDFSRLNEIFTHAENSKSPSNNKI